MYDLSAWTPGDHFGILIQVMVGPADGPGEESFDITLCTPSWIAERLRTYSPVDGRHHLFVDHYDYDAIRKYIDRRVTSCHGETWDDVAQQVARLGHWEFEDYVPSAP